MICKYIFGHPFETDAVVIPVDEASLSSQPLPVGEIDLTSGFSFRCQMEDSTVVYGLGEANRGINKRGYIYESFNTDDFLHTENKTHLYASDNFIILSGPVPCGFFFDYPGKMTFDIGYSHHARIHVSCDKADLKLYVITGENAYDIVRQFRRIIGRSYIPPKFAFGFGQSRWGYMNADDIKAVADGYRENGLPLDMIYMDIDYMQDYKDFTVNPERFPDFADFVAALKEDEIRLVPIIDAGVKIEKGYSVYDEGVSQGYFCKKADGSDFVAAVWPGYTHFPDVLNPDARRWFGDKYKVLLDQGIEAFWNDMNEPSIFYTPEGLKELKDFMARFAADEEGIYNVNQATGAVLDVKCSDEDYRRMHHQVDGQLVCHYDVHNLFGYNMTRAAGEAFERLSPDKRILMFSRSSYIGMHRYGGVWTGDNASWWSHILLNLKMMPSLNMCGFLYAGADIGGFNDNVTRDLLLRWLALGLFFPLMRDHTIEKSRFQECYQFEDMDDFRHVLSLRYRLVPYIYSTYLKAALTDDLYCKPLAFAFPEDSLAAEIEDQMLIGDEIMIAPVYTQNTSGRYVYLPEDMMQVSFLPDGCLQTQILPAGHHYIHVALNEVVLFIRKDRCIPLAAPAECVADVDNDSIVMIGWPDSEYELWDDDGVTPYEKNIDLEDASKSMPCISRMHLSL